jgi:hypothetical protein
MRKWFVAAAALVAFGIPAAYAAAPDKEKPATAAQAQDSEESAAKACKAERQSLGPEAFQKKFGTNHNLRNAFGKCVSAKSKDGDDEKDEADDEGEKSSGTAKACKAERTSIGADAFAKKYGTNHNLHNAFGKCVSSKAKSKAKDKDDDEKDHD